MSNGNDAIVIAAVAAVGAVVVWYLIKKRGSNDEESEGLENLSSFSQSVSNDLFRTKRSSSEVGGSGAFAPSERKWPEIGFHVGTDQARSGFSNGGVLVGLSWKF